MAPCWPPPTKVLLEQQPYPFVIFDCSCVAKAEVNSLQQRWNGLQSLKYFPLGSPHKKFVVPGIYVLVRLIYNISGLHEIEVYFSKARYAFQGFWGSSTIIEDPASFPVVFVASSVCHVYLTIQDGSQNSSSHPPSRQ